jgi:hypothetical protein
MGQSCCACFVSQATVPPVTLSVVTGTSAALERAVPDSHASLSLVSGHTEKVAVPQAQATTIFSTIHYSLVIASFDDDVRRTMIY